MSEKGQIVLPKEIRDRQGYAKGTAFSVLETKDGAIFLKPVNAQPKMDLVDHLLGFKGLEIEIPERKHFCPPRL